jgi:hypothetical protein
MDPKEKLIEIGTSAAAIDAVMAGLVEQARLAIANPQPFARLQALPEAELRFSDLERQLDVSHRHDFEMISWHGRSSQQRILWQYDPFLRAISEPAMVLGLLARAAGRRELDIGGGNTLSALLLGGLAANRPSYLATVSPNWRNKPRLPGLDWSELSDMDVPCCIEERSRTITHQLLQQFGRSLAAVREALLELFPLPGFTVSGGLYCAIQHASTAALLETLLRLDRNQAAVLVRGEAGLSTAIDRMNGQCLEVMKYYPRILELTENRNDVALGYGLVSHALDAKHLIAGVVMTLGAGRKSRQFVNSECAAVSLRSLVERAAAHTLSARANDLMRIRFQQAVHLVAGNLDSIGLSLAGFRASVEAACGR